MTWKERITDWRLYAALAALLAAISLTFALFWISAELGRVRGESECRSRIAGRVTQESGEVNRATGLGLRALVQEDEAELARQVEAVRVHSVRLDVALEARKASEDRCAE